MALNYQRARKIWDFFRTPGTVGDETLLAQKGKPKTRQHLSFLVLHSGVVMGLLFSQSSHQRCPCVGSKPKESLEAFLLCQAAERGWSISLLQFGR